MIIPQNMLKHSVVNPRVWYRFSKTGNLGKKCFRYETLQDDRFEDFLDFKMKYYVKRERTHVLAGIYKNPEAMVEYREIIGNTFRKPPYEVSVCYLDNEDSSDIVAFSAMKLYRKGDIYSDTEQAYTKEVKLLYKILHEWNKLCPVPDLVVKYGVDKFYEDVGLCADPKYIGYGFAHHTCMLRRLQCIENGVPLTGVWTTSMATQKATPRTDGWETIYEITTQEIEKKLGITLDSEQKSFKFIALKV